MPYRMNIIEYERNNGECLYPFCPNIGVKYHVIPHRVIIKCADFFKGFVSSFNCHLPNHCMVDSFRGNNCTIFIFQGK